MTVADRVELPVGTLVIADLHLDLEREEGLTRFLAWTAAHADAPRLLILGDLFEYWFGMGQARSVGGRRVLAALAALTGAGTAVDVVPGNRDFLLGRAFEAASGCRVRPAGMVGVLPGGDAALFLHGDELCTEDHGYQRLRRVLRSRAVRTLGPRLPAFVGRALARRLRSASRRAVARKPPAEAALQPAAALLRVQAAGAGTLVCGHAHTFRDEEMAPGGPRWLVLGAFGSRGDALVVGESGKLEVAPGTRPPC